MTIRWDERRASLSEEPCGLDGVRLPFDPIGGVPRFDLELAGSRRHVLFDTGAPLAYARSDLLEGLPPAACRARDESPIMGRWETPVRVLAARAGGIDLPLPAGELPEHAQTLLAFQLADAVVGTALFRAFDPIAVDFLAREIVLVPRPALAATCPCEPADPPILPDGQCPWRVEG